MTGRTQLIDSFVDCPEAKDFELSTELVLKLFVDAPVIGQLPEGSDSVYAAGLIKSHRKQTIEHNQNKNENIETARKEINESIKKFNDTKNEIRRKCIEARAASNKD